MVLAVVPDPKEPTKEKLICLCSEEYGLSEQESEEALDQIFGGYRVAIAPNVKQCRIRGVKFSSTKKGDKITIGYEFPVPDEENVWNQKKDGPALDDSRPELSFAVESLKPFICQILCIDEDHADDLTVVSVNFEYADDDAQTRGVSFSVKKHNNFCLESATISTPVVWEKAKGGGEDSTQCYEILVRNEDGSRIRMVDCVDNLVKELKRYLSGDRAQGRLAI